MMNAFNGMFGKIASGMCRLSMNGELAIKTSDGSYKVYNTKTHRLINCDKFVFDVGEDFFFVIPTAKVEAGDIILVNGKPKCVVTVTDETIKVIDYEDSSVKEILPERHVFMGNVYFYGKIVSMFGNNFMKGKKGMDKIMSYMLMSEMLGGNKSNSNGMNSLLPMMLLGNGSFSDLFDGMFDFNFDAAAETDAEEEDKEAN